MLEFQLFRIKVFPPAQRSLFPEQQKTPQQILVDVVRSLPELEIRKGVVWHIGNVSEIDDEGFYFRLGRTSRATIEIYRDGKFLDQEFPVSPYTHVVLDTALEICAVARKTKLSKTPRRLANKIQRLLLASPLARETGTGIEVGAVTDPEDFIAHLWSAHSINRFWVTFTRPNAIDADRDFIKPMERLLKEADGHKGKTELEGESLETATLESLARSAASTGDDAGASIRTEAHQPKTRVRLTGNVAVVTNDEPQDDEEKRGLLWKVRERYHAIREGLSK